ncbi:MAG TPA: FtsX-like permease family protein, partial [Vicinamibacterales bacterium]|nr:FtsX-like permease family protein [Vicinamibacterales bacterium]
GGGDIHFSDAWRSDLPNVPPVDMVVESYNVGPDFFTLYGIPILRGRTFQTGDADSEVIVGERFAGRLWPGVDPVGHTFQFDQETYHVIGLAREIRRPSVDPRDDRPQFYRPFTLGGQYVMMSIRCAGACPDGAIVRQRILAAAPTANIVRLGPLDDVYDQQLAPPRAAGTLTTVFAAVALIAAAGGLFSVLSFSVGLRRREFGVRAALGATPASLRTLVLSDGLMVAAAGFAIGAIAALALGRTLASFEYGITARDPLSWALVSGVVAITVLAAAWLPARRAMRADPAQLLRQE